MIDWSAILTEHGAAVWRTVYRLLNHHADASDCYQEVLLAAWRFTRAHPVEDWVPFLITLATRRAIDRLRHRYRGRNEVVAPDGVPEPSSEADCPIQRAAAHELMDRVREGLAGLPEKQAEVFWLSCVEGLPRRWQWA